MLHGKRATWLCTWRLYFGFGLTQVDEINSGTTIYVFCPPRFCWIAVPACSQHRSALMRWVLYSFNPLHARFFRDNKKSYVFTFHVIPPHWHDTGSWNPSSSKTRTYHVLSYIVIIMDADVLVTQGARASATMILMLNQINLVPTC